MLARCWPGQNPLESSCFFAHPDCLAAIASAELLWDVDESAPFGRLHGRPIFPLEVAPAVGTEGDFGLCSMDDYLIASAPARTWRCCWRGSTWRSRSEYRLTHAVR